eukprot:970781_1
MMSCSRQEYCFRQLHTLIQTKINIHTSFISKFLLASFHDQIDRTFDRDKMAMRNQIITVLCMVIAVLGFWTVWNLLNAADGVDTLEKFRKVTDSFARSDPEEVAVDDSRSLVKGDDLDLSLNAELDVLDAGKWYRGRVIGRHQEKREVKIHYFGWDAKYDIWIPDNSDRFAPRGTHETKGPFSVDGHAICGLKQSYNVPCANGSSVIVGCRWSDYGDYYGLSWMVELRGSPSPVTNSELFYSNENVTSTDSRVRRLCGVHDLECTINNTSICAQRVKSEELYVLSQVACKNGANVRIQSCADDYEMLESRVVGKEANVRIQRHGNYRIVFLLPNGKSTEKDGFTDRSSISFKNDELFAEICEIALPLTITKR